MQQDLFANKSKVWDKGSKRVKNAKAIADTILKNIKLDKQMQLLDFGAGTGLLSYHLAPHVAKIVALDNSPSMLEKFREKAPEFACETEIVLSDIADYRCTGCYDGIVSSMTMHHVEDIPTLFRQMHALLKPNGFIALADLDSEDGSFHSDNTGVYHFGFDREKLSEVAKTAGFEKIAFETASTIAKEDRSYSVFLMTAVVSNK